MCVGVLVGLGGRKDVVYPYWTGESAYCQTMAPSGPCLLPGAGCGEQLYGNLTANYRSWLHPNAARVTTATDSSRNMAYVTYLVKLLCQTWSSRPVFVSCVA